MKHWIVPLLCLGMVGCASRELPAPYVYTLQPVAETPATAQKPLPNGLTLKLTSLRGSRPFTSTRMLYSEHGIDQNAFAFSRWSDAPTRLLQLLLWERLSHAGLFKAVIPPGSPLRSDLTLEGTLLDFSLHLEERQPLGVLEIRFLLANNSDRRVVASRLFRVAVPAEKADAEHAARALAQATDELARQLVAWLRPLVSPSPSGS